MKILKSRRLYNKRNLSNDEYSLRSYTKTIFGRIENNHPKTLIIGDKDAGVSTRRIVMFQEQALISLVEPKKFAEARKNNDWINAMNDELDKIEKNQTWELVPRP